MHVNQDNDGFSKLLSWAHFLNINYNKQPQQKKLIPTPSRWKREWEKFKMKKWNQATLAHTQDAKHNSQSR